MKIEVNESTRGNILKRKPSVLLIDPIDHHGALSRNLQLPLGLIALANYLKNQTMVQTVRIIDLTLNYLVTKNPEETSIDALLDASGIFEHSWDIIGVSTHFTNTLTSIEIATRMRTQYPGAVIVFGGVHATSCYSNLLSQFPVIDLVILGEGELALAEICRVWSSSKVAAPDFSNVPGCAIRQLSGGIVTRPNDKMLALEQIGGYDFSIVPTETYVSETAVESFWIDSGRGCVFKCGFCISAKHWGHRSRYFSAEKILTDLIALKKYGISKFKFTHDQFTVNKRKVSEICHAILAAKLEIEWGCYSRVDEFPFEELALMAQAGCRQIFVGVESVLVEVQKGLRKLIPSDQLTHIMNACVSQGIELESNIILGLPEHDEQTILNELLFCSQLRRRAFSRLSISPLELYPSTPFYQKSEYQALFRAPSAVTAETQALFSFQFEHRRTFWGIPMRAFIECFRTLTTYFPCTIERVLQSNNGYPEVAKWFFENAVNLSDIHKQEGTSNFVRLVELLNHRWGSREEISDFLFLEAGMALVTLGFPDEITLNSPSGSSLSIRQGAEIRLRTRATFDDSGSISEQTLGDYQFINIAGVANDLVITIDATQ